MIKFTINGDAIKGTKKGLKQSNLETAIIGSTEAKSLAPVKYGQFRNSIMYGGFSAEGDKVTGDYSADDDGASPVDVSIKDGEAFFGSNTDHTLEVEYGTKNMAAQPTLRPAAKLAQGKSVRQVKALIAFWTIESIVKGKIKKVFSS